MSAAAPRQAFVLFVLCVLDAPEAVLAQSSFEMIPSISTAELYDSNLFARADDRQADTVSRVSPAIDSTYRSSLMTIVGRYNIEAERFANHPRLTTAHARQFASVDVRYGPNRRLAFATDAVFSTTQNPSELNVDTGITIMRASARRTLMHPTITYHLDPVTTGRMEYTFAEDHIVDSPRLRTQTFGLALNRKLSKRDAATMDYGFHEFVFGSDRPTTSHVFTVGWKRGLTRLTSLTLGGGPRVTDGAAAADLSAAIHYQLRPADLALSYARAQTTVIGLEGTVETDGIEAEATYHPRPFLQMRIAPAVLRSTRAGFEARVYRLSFDMTRRIVGGLSLEARYAATLQHGTLAATLANATIPRHDVMIRLVLARQSHHSAVPTNALP